MSRCLHTIPFARSRSHDITSHPHDRGIQIRNLAVHTQNTYPLQVALFARHFNKSPELLGPEQIRTYQVYLTNEKSWRPVRFSSLFLRFASSTSDPQKSWAIDDVIPLPRSRSGFRSFLAPKK